VILAAALLVLVALGLFLAGLATGVTVWYWTCVAVSALAALLLIAARRQLSRADEGGRAKVTAAAASTKASTAGGSTASTVVAKEPAAPADEKPAESEPEQADAEPAPAPAPPPAAAPAPEPEPAPAASPESADGGDPAAEDVDVTDLLLVVDMHDDVFVVDEHPRYHLADCSWLAKREAIPIPVNEARTDGFTPCGVCSPDRYLAQVARARNASTS